MRHKRPVISHAAVDHVLAPYQVKTIQARFSSQRSRDQAAESSRLRRLIGFLAFAILLALAFVYPLVSLMRYAHGNDLHSHITLVPFISAFLIYIRRKELPMEYVFSPGLTLLSLVAGVATLLASAYLFWTARAVSHNDWLSLMAFSFVCLLMAGGFLFLGRKWMSAVIFPFAFLIFMVPLPDGLVDLLETASKLASAEAAALFFSIPGTPVLRDGTVFQLPGIVIEVARECSGIRSSLVLFITSALASYLFLRSPWRRAILIAFVIPLGILRNGLRIVTIGLLCAHFGPHMIHSIIHQKGGQLFFGLSLIPLFLLLWWLRRSEVAADAVQSSIGLRISNTGETG